jgi:hypothetical protein
MKARKIVYLILAVILIILDFYTTLVRVKDMKSHFTSGGYDIGYLIGSQFLLYIGIGLIYCAYRVQQKINKRNRQALLDGFDEID